MAKEGLIYTADIAVRMSYGKWARCKACGEDITKDQLRIGCRKGTGWQSWYHVGCLSCAQAGEAEVALKAGRLDGAAGLPASRQQELRAALAREGGAKGPADAAEEPPCKRPRQSSDVRFRAECVARPGFGGKYAKCNACREDIEKLQLRLGSSKAGGWTSWWHLSCVSVEQCRALEEAGGVERAEGFAKLSAGQQEFVRRAVGGQ